MLQINNVKFSIGERTLFSNLNLSLDRPDKVGLIGVNGVGKSTLLKIITKQLMPDNGSITYPKDYIIDYLPQEPVFDFDQSIIDYLLTGDLPVIKVLREYENALEAFDEHPEDKFLSSRIIKLQEEIDRLNGWELESQIKSVLTKLNIGHLTVNVRSLSGGQKKRVALAASILRPSDLLILDEPTNHLDDVTIMWLENFLINRNTSLLLVTHDRYFLDRVTNKIIELDQGNLYSYTGNYSNFVEKKAERMSLLNSLEQKRTNLYRKELAWMRQGAQGRATKQKARIDRFETLENLSYEVATSNVDLLSGYTRMGKKTIELTHLTMGFDDKNLFEDFSVLLEREDRIGIIGPNGCGKTTLVNLIIGKLQPKSGMIDIGPTIKLGYYSQYFPELNDQMTLIDYIKETAEYVMNEDGYRVSASIMLERFLFDKNTHYSPINKLSGGERRRLYLLKVLMESPNVLILDEPTNDLDIDTLKALEDYLDEFLGIVIVVSHDRYFLDRICKRLFVMGLNSSTIQVLTGNYSEYVEKYGITTPEASVPSIQTDDAKMQEKVTPETLLASDEIRKVTYKEKIELESLEPLIDALEKRLDALELSIIDHQADYVALQNALDEKDLVETQLLECMERLEFLSALRK